VVVGAGGGDVALANGDDAISRDLVEGGDHVCIGGGVKCGGAFVEHDDGGFAVEEAGDCAPLALSSRKPDAAVPDNCGKALGEWTAVRVIRVA
jgi:hypothetical protein